MDTPQECLTKQSKQITDAEDGIHQLIFLENDCYFANQGVTIKRSWQVVQGINFYVLSCTFQKKPRTTIYKLKFCK